MIVLDTNVVSELMRVTPDRNVLIWGDAVGPLHTTAVTLAEVGYGIARLPEGKRKDRLVATAAQVFAEFDEMVLPFDSRAARVYADIVADRERAGRPIAAADAQIAAICWSRRAQLATRNTGDFEATGISLLDPWAT